MCRGVAKLLAQAMRKKKSKKEKKRRSSPVYRKSSKSSRKARSSSSNSKGRPMGHDVLRIDVLPNWVWDKIERDEYVNLSDLLFHQTKKPRWAMVGWEDQCPVWEEVEADNKALSWLQWTQAFNLYAHAYVQIYPSADLDLRSYAIYIHQLMTKGKRIWADYDEKFRRERASLKSPWDTYRPEVTLDLWMKASSKVEAPRSQSVPPPQTVQVEKPLAVIDKPCFAYNDRRRGCSNALTCPYSHICRKCRGPHPLFEHWVNQRRPDHGSKPNKAKPKTTETVRAKY